MPDRPEPSEEEVERVAEALAEEFGEWLYGYTDEDWRDFARRLLAIARGEME